MLRAPSFSGRGACRAFLRLYSCDFVQLHSATQCSAIFAQYDFVL